jgi:hypothetical protein
MENAYIGSQNIDDIWLIIISIVWLLSITILFFSMAYSIWNKKRVLKEYNKMMESKSKNEKFLNDLKQKYKNVREDVNRLQLEFNFVQDIDDKYIINKYNNFLKSSLNHKNE